jgi:hypothetical protein
MRFDPILHAELTSIAQFLVGGAYPTWLNIILTIYFPIISFDY